ncbi:ATP-binding protein [Streptomyces brasiliensis]|uniref:histidine kinase n=1 Tax=Streptomyces brasiliensis TaxID=1954 RepID=A0A917P272_9ACTN|nr:ATP-binding protein [Streptomyces brasiliensis]GGJ55101.1 ATPase [Streptomyces brasiliensis]
MAQLRAPAARADRREGGRHGRPVTRPVPALPETHIRPQLLRLAVLPPVGVALSGTAAVLFTVRSTGARPGIVLWAVLAGALAVTVAGIVIAAVAAGRTARSVGHRVGALRRNTARGEADLRLLLEALRRGDGPPPQRKLRGGPPQDADDFELLAADLARAHDGAVTAVVSAAQLSSQAGSAQKLEVFVNLARRLQSLVHREISILDEIENEIEDPDLLKGLFHVDHLATRIRRHAENLAVLGGAVSRRQWSNPVSMTEVLRSAIAEVEQYSRVKLVPPIDGELRGHAVADVIHLLAELVENATVFSAPHTQVLLRANLVTAGLAVEVEDRGLGMPVGEQSRMNALLADPDQVNVGSLLADGRIGLFVVSQLARRHGINVRLQTNIYGGVQAVIVVPQGLLGTAPGAPGAVPQPRGAGGVPPNGGRRAGSTAGAPAGVVPGGAVPGARNGSYAGSAGPNWSTAPGQQPQPQPQPQPQSSGRPASSVETAGGQRRLVQPDAVRPPTVASAEGGAPAPLPVRGPSEARPNPAEAVPGTRYDERPGAENTQAVAPASRTGTVRGTMGRPQLPRRRAQEHLAPQLKGGPAPRQESETLAGHDPGLMAAFQRGIGLAETEQHVEATDTGRAGATAESQPVDRGATDTGAAHMGPGHMGQGDMGHMGPDHVGPEHMDSAHTDPLQAPHMDAPHVDAPHMEPAPTPGATPTLTPRPTGLPHPDAALAEASLRAPEPELTARPDGSAPAG